MIEKVNKKLELMRNFISVLTEENMAIRSTLSL